MDRLMNQMMDFGQEMKELPIPPPKDDAEDNIKTEDVRNMSRRRERGMEGRENEPRRMTARLERV
jgi:hypothetical protein